MDRIAVRAPGAGRSLAPLALVLVTLSWGYNWVVMKQTTSLVSPSTFLAARLLLGAACLFVVIKGSGRSWRVGHAGSVLAIGLTHSAATFGLMMWALMTGDAGKSSVLAYSMPFFVILLAWPVLGERPSRLQWLATLVALAGMALLVDPTLEPTTGSWLALASGAAWAVGVVLTRRHQTLHPDDTVALSAWQSLVGGLALAALAACLPGERWSWSGYVVFALLYNGILISAIAWVAWFWVLGRLDSSVASLGTLAAPVVGIVAGMIELGERPTTLDWAGIALVLLALALTAVGAARGPGTAARNLGSR